MKTPQSTIANIYSTRRQRELLKALRRLVDECAREKQNVEQRQTDILDQLKRDHGAGERELRATYQSDWDSLNKKYLEALEAARHRYEAQLHTLREDKKRSLDELSNRHDEELDQAREDWQSSRHQADWQYAEDKKELKAFFLRLSKQLDRDSTYLRDLEARVERQFQRRRIQPDLQTAQPGIRDDWMDNPSERLGSALNFIAQVVDCVERFPASRFIDDGWTILVFIFATTAAVIPFGMTFGWGGWSWAILSLLSSIVVTGIARAGARLLATRNANALLPRVREAVGDARHAMRRARKVSYEDEQRRREEIRQARNDRLQKADAAWQALSNELVSRCGRARKEVERRFETQRKEIERAWQRTATSANEEIPPRMDAREQRFKSELAELTSGHERAIRKAHEHHDAQWSQLRTKWSSGFASVTEEIDQMNQLCNDRFPDYSRIDWTQWKSDDRDLPAVPFGRYTVELSALSSSLPVDDRLPEVFSSLTIPAFLSLPECPSLVLKTNGSAREQAIDAMQAIIVRALTSLPPGKVRLTFIDPTGLGQNFSAFMHLADYDEKLVNNRIWTESSHIDQRLADLTEHMENVIQKYLRNEYSSIQEYNEHAGEVAEPFQILVVANFPANFSDEAARRLLTIAKTGPRCGVYMLISVDTQLKLPRNLVLDDLQFNANVLCGDDDGFQWEYEDLRSFNVTLDRPPSDELVNEILHAVGRHAEDANRVEVPFHTVAPEPRECWSKDSRSEILVPLGRSGATQLQSMRLGRGTAQHVLISGKTGSGKSTLLNAMVTNIGLHYGPDDVQFYLIDFKKGVEFKPYAEYELPHARVIAIESEREFGMSVLEQLDRELHDRGDLLRNAGVQNIEAYRNAKAAAKMPRLLLIIDEFQEFFVKDDKIAQDAALLLDRLVRQGRAFGIHCILGSQTLGGAYSLARSTIGQIAVRIALQCSEADSHLILSEDNTAARLLNRPGEAIYNNANGLFEGNHLFQAVWLPDDARAKYLGEIGALAKEQKASVSAPIVFEGNAAADPSENSYLRAALAGTADSKIQRSPKAWLGAAISIKEPTAAIMARHGGRNLLIIGQQESLAIGILSNCIISLAASQPRQGDNRTARTGQFIVLDGAGGDSMHVGYWKSFAKRLPLDLQVANPRDAAAVLGDIATEVDRRQIVGDEDGDEQRESIFVVIHNLSRFRDFRKSDDDFGFSGIGDAKPATPSQMLASVLRDGPAVGVHILMWCDSYNNLMRCIDRQALRDLELRVLFQMSATDSSNLMDSASASRLGMYRAMFYSEETGQSERFRPYASPSDEWLTWVSARLNDPSVSIRFADKSTADSLKELPSSVD